MKRQPVRNGLDTPMDGIIKIFAVIPALLIYGLFWGVVIAGYVYNIQNVIASQIDDITLLLVIQLIGLFVFPLGAILGWVV